MSTELLPPPGPGKRYVIMQDDPIVVIVEDAPAPAKRGRKPGTPNPNGGRHPSTAPKTRVSLTADAAALLAEFAQKVNVRRGEATRQDEIASAVIVRYLTEIDPGMKFSASAISGMIDRTNAQEAGTL